MNEYAADDPIRAALVRDDPAAVELIWERYVDDLLAYLQAVLCSRHDAEDVLQTVFVRIVKKRFWLARARHLDAYVYRIARNEADRFLKDKRRLRRPQTEPDRWLQGAEPDRPDNDLLEQLQVALEHLPPAQRQVVVLKVYRAKTFEQIAELLGIRPNTAASRYRYGMEKLRNMLGDKIL